MAVGIEPALGRTAGISIVASISDKKQTIALRSHALRDPERAGQSVGISMEIDKGQHTWRRRPVQRAQGEAILGSVGDFLKTGDAVEIGWSRGHIRPEDHRALQSIESADQQCVKTNQGKDYR
jgi:hypothetical protein